MVILELNLTFFLFHCTSLCFQALAALTFFFQLSLGLASAFQFHKTFSLIYICLVIDTDQLILTEHIFVDINGRFGTKPNLHLFPWHFTPFSGPGLLDLLPPTPSLPCCCLPGLYLEQMCSIPPNSILPLFFGDTRIIHPTMWPVHCSFKSNTTDNGTKNFWEADKILAISELINNFNKPNFHS
jgi:hypothetical protein